MIAGKIKNREHCEVIIIIKGDDNSKGCILVICDLCGQRFGVSPDIPQEKIAEEHDKIPDIDHKYEPKNTIL